MNTDQLVRRVMEPAYRDRERDILDARWLGDITNDQALKQLTELYQDWHEAHSTLRTAQQGADK